MTHSTYAQEQELIDVERQFWNAMQEKDAVTASKLTDEQCVIVGAQGVSAIDANSGMAGDQVFGWGGNTATANALWFEVSGANTILFGDTDGNAATAEFMITLQGFTGFGPYSDPLSPPPDITF